MLIVGAAVLVYVVCNRQVICHLCLQLMGQLLVIDCIKNGAIIYKWPKGFQFVDVDETQICVYHKS